MSFSLGRNALWILLVFLLCLRAEAKLRRRYWEAHFGGSFKSIYAHQTLRQTGIFPDNNIPVAEQRVRLEGALTREWFRMEVASQTSLYSQFGDQPLFLLPNPTQNSFWDSSTQIFRDQKSAGIHRFDRAFVEVAEGAWTVRVGKQVITLGEGRLFPVVSQSPQHPFLIIDPEYRRTEDAVSVGFQKQVLLEGRYLPHSRGQQKDNFHFRLKGVFGNADSGFVGGRSDDKEFLGWEFITPLGEALVRAEVAGYSQFNNIYVQGLLGWDRVLSQTLRMGMEAYYNGFGTSLAEYPGGWGGHRSTPYLGKWYAGTYGQWDITPLFAFTFQTVVNLQDPSALFHLRLGYSLIESLDIVLGQYLSASNHPRGEFGGQIPLVLGTSIGLPDMTYVLMRYYF